MKFHINKRTFLKITFFSFFFNNFFSLLNPKFKKKKMFNQIWYLEINDS